MQASPDVPKAPPKGYYTAKWKQVKTNFKAVTGKKKPAPNKDDQKFFEKMKTVDSRQGTGIDTAIANVEKALIAVTKGKKEREVAEKAYFELDGAMTTYIRFLETVVATAPQDVDPALWKQQVIIMKGELRRIRLGLKAYLDKLKMSQAALANQAQMAQTIFHDMDADITLADKWVVLHLRDDVPDTTSYSGEGVTFARNITQKLTNLHKLPILIDFTHNRGDVPHHIEDTLEAFANGRRKYTNLNEYQQRLHEFGQALGELRLWLHK